MTEQQVLPESRKLERRRKLVEIRRGDAIAAATLVFAEKGFHEAQMAEIAAQAELSLASLYSLFEGKEDIYQQILQAAASRMREDVQKSVAHIEHPRQRVLSLIGALFECFEENRTVLRLALSGTNGLPWRIRQRMGNGGRSLMDDFGTWVTGLCDEALLDAAAPRVEGWALKSAVIGSVTQAAAFSIDTDPDTPLTSLTAGVRAIFEHLLDAESEI